MNRNFMIFGAVAIVVIATVAVYFVFDDPDDPPEDPGFRTEFKVSDFIRHEVMMEDGVVHDYKRVIISQDPDGTWNVAVMDIGSLYTDVFGYTSEEFAAFMGGTYAYEDVEPVDVTIDTPFGKRDVKLYSQERDGVIENTYLDRGVTYYMERVRDGVVIEYSKLTDSTLIDKDPSLTNSNGIRIDLRVGDYINFNEVIVIRSGTIIEYREILRQYHINGFTATGDLEIIDFPSGKFSTMTVDEYLGLILYDGVISPDTAKETINTPLGKEECYVVVDGETTKYVSEYKVIYKTVEGNRTSTFDSTSLWN